MTWIILETIPTKEYINLVKNISDDIIKLYGFIYEEVQTTVKQEIATNNTITIKKEFSQKPKFKISTKCDDTIVLSFCGTKDEFDNLRHYLYVKYDLIIYRRL